MKRIHAHIANTPSICAFLLALLLAAIPATAAPTGEVVEIENRHTKLVFYPVVEEPYNRIIVTVTGPCNYEYREVIKPGDVGVWRLSAETIDAIYRVQAVAMPEVDGNILEILQQARKEDEYSQVNALCREGALPGAPLTQALGFRVFEGKIQWDPDEQEDQFASTPDSSTTGGDSFIPLKDFVINDDLIVDGSACIGFDCVNGESFGFDTIRLKEHNLRIKFEDTSTAASFPGNDWQLTANASANGGASKFSIDDISGSRTPFTVEANARSHSLYVDDGGRIGNRTSTPSTEIHTIDGDTPTLRLQQDGSSGFAPQTWDVAGNETNFFIRDVSNGSTLPFRIRPGAPTSSIFIDVSGDVGLGTASPDESLHVLATDGSAKILVEETNGTDASRALLRLSNTGNVLFELQNSNTAGTSGNTWSIGNSAGNDFVVNNLSDGDIQMRIFDADSGGDSNLVRFFGEVEANGMNLGSDRNSKTDFETLDNAAILAKVLEMPITEWRYKKDETVRHIGPMAQDFYSAFGIGRDELHISPLDGAGVALAAIQGLEQRLREKEQAFDSKIAELEALISALSQK